MNRHDRKLKMLTVSKDLNKFFPEDIKKVELFNFADGKLVLSVATGSARRLVGTVDNCWIRIFDQSGLYYDFISSEVYFDTNDSGVYLLASEDTEFISVNMISEMISDFIDDLKERKLTNTQYVERYSSMMVKEIRVATKELSQLQSVSAATDASRLDIEDSYEYSRNQLIRKYLLNLIASKIIKENKEAILEFISS